MKDYHNPDLYYVVKGALSFQFGFSDLKLDTRDVTGDLNMSPDGKRRNTK
jgi:hypothetical protein